MSSTMLGRVKGALPLLERSPLAQAIRTFRLTQGWNQKELGTSTGLSAFQIAVLETQSLNVPMRLNALYISKFKEAGLDLSGLTGLEITTGIVRAKKSPSDLTVKVKREAVDDSLNKATALVLKTKAAYEAKINQIDLEIEKLEEKANEYMLKTEDLRNEKEGLKTKVHKADLSLENIKLAMI